ncbi:hypothetical protein V7S43_008748 [Phytophthora oleae]|uniref:SWIM-type domain-containing protein n=1 Tax=Phytophthora oleae TaxID=2107226 RepID=A0ABD3FK47_9STRA
MVENVELNYLSLHRVQVTTLTEIVHDVNQHSWTLTEIEAVRQKYQRDCKMWYCSGWVCSHVVACLSLTGDYPLERMQSSLKARRPPGRPRKLQALDRAPDSNALPSRFYAVENLIATLTKSPSRFLNWSIVKEFAIDGKVQNMQGTVTSWANRNGRYVWTIEFAGREPEVVPMEEPAQIIAYKHATGGTFTH